MKTIITCIFAIIITTTIIGQNDCSAFYPFKEGTKTEITTYDKKNKVAAKVTYVVSSVSNNNSKSVAAMQSTIKGADGNEISQTTYDVTCSNDGIEIDFNSMFSPQLAMQFKDMETDVSGTNIILPNNLTVGQTLPDATMNARINMSGITMNMDVKMTNRKVVAQESITTPAGTFDCYVLEYTSELKMGMSKKGSAKQWIAKGVGMVKQEDYNKRGKVTSSSLLTSFTK